MTRPVEPMDNHGTWIGRISTANHVYSQLKPMARLVDGAWQSLGPEERIARFPRGGLVLGGFSKALIEAYRNGADSLWVFECRPSKGEDGWAVEAPEQALPLVDLSGMPMADARRRLFDTGLRLPKGDGRQAVVLLEGGTYALLRFGSKARGGPSFVRLPPDRIVELRRADPSWKVPGRDDPPYLPHKGLPSGEIVSRLDWSSDADFLNRLLERYRAALDGYLLLRDGNEAGRRPEKALAELRLGQGSAAELEAIVERMRTEWPQIARALGAVEGMTRLLMETDEAKRLLADAVEHRRGEMTTDLERQVRAEVEERLRGFREELEHADREVETRRQELSRLEAGTAECVRDKDLRVADLRQVEARLTESEAMLEAARREAHEVGLRNAAAQAEFERIHRECDELAGSVERSRAAISDLVRGIRNEVEASAAHERDEVRLFAARVERLLAQEGMPVAAMAPPSVPPWWAPARSRCQSIGLSELRRRLEEEAQRHGVLTDDLVLLDGFARAGELVLLLGDQAELSLHAYARAVAGGEIRFHAVDPTAIGLDDLWRIPTRSRPTAFAVAWHHAQVNPQDTVLVCLRDFDAAPFRLWLASLQAVLASDDRPRNLLVTAVPSLASSFRDTEEQDAAALRHVLVALGPRPRPGSASAEVVLDEPPPPPTSLRWGTGEVRGPSRVTFKVLVDRGGHPRVVRRALRLVATLGEATGNAERSVPAMWAAYLHDGIASVLPAALAAGAEGIRALAVQR